MKQTIVASGLALLVGLVPVSFISQTASAIGLPVINDEVTALKKTVDQTVTNGKSEAAHEAHQPANNGNHGNGSDNATNATSDDSSDPNSPAPNNRFSAAKLRACEKHQEQIISSISSISDRGAKQLEVFHTIAQRAKAFYAAKGYSSADYNTLAAEVDSLYDESLVAVNTTQSSGDTWSCNGTDPTAQLEQFKQAKEAEMTALAAYKDKVQALLVLVKTAASTTTGGAQ